MGNNIFIITLLPVFYILKNDQKSCEQNEQKIMRLYYLPSNNLNLVTPEDKLLIEKSIWGID
jgi:hypothetical protein